MPTKICVCSPEGEPTNRSTWSGTPANLCRVLAEMGRLQGTVDSSRFLPDAPSKLLKGIAGVYYGGFYGTERGVFARHLRARLVGAGARRLGATDVLHTGTIDMPIAGDGHGLRHYLYCDLTWEQWLHNLKNARYSPRLLRAVDRLERTSYHQMAHIFCTGEYVRESLLSRYGVPPERVTAVGTGCGAIQPYSGEKDYANGYILFVAKLNFEGKGGPLLVEGFKRARRRNPNLRMIIVGDPAHHALVGDLPNVEVRGFVEFSQLQELFNQAALFAMPATNEPWGLVYLEAMSCQTPILALARNAVPEMTAQGKYGYMLADESPDAVADALVDAFSDPARLAAMGREGQRATLVRYTWERVVAEIVETVDRCAA